MGRESSSFAKRRRRVVRVLVVVVAAAVRSKVQEAQHSVSRSVGVRMKIRVAQISVTDLPSCK